MVWLYSGLLQVKTTRQCDAVLEFATNSEQRGQTNRSCSATLLKETLQEKKPRACRDRWDHHIIGAIHSGHSGMGQRILKDRLNVRQADEVDGRSMDRGEESCCNGGDSCCDVGGSCCIGKVIVSEKGGCSSDEEDDEGIRDGGEACGRKVAGSTCR